MKTKLHILCIVLLASCLSAAAGTDGKDSGTSYLDAIRFDNRTLEKGGREVTLDMDIVLDSAKIRTQHTVMLTPVLVSSDGSKEFPFGTVIVDGRARHKVFMRKNALKDLNPQRDSALSIILRKNNSEQEYAYLSSIPYDRAMLDGRLEIRECVRGCIDCGEGDSTAVLESPVLEKFIPQWKTSRIEPDPEPVKHREESRVARLQFQWDKYDILENWQDNAAVLDTVTNSIALVKDKDYIVITGIYVAGYASPEGTWEYNIRLSRNRAQSFAEYIAGHNDVDTSLISVEWSGEDWDGFRHALQRSSFPKKDDVIGIIDTFTEDRNECERRMMDILSREEYVWLLRNIYPYLRHCIYRVEYDVEGFDLDRARTVIRENPSDLSLQEMYMVAGSYEPDSVEYAYAMETAARHYPDSPAVMGDRALAALEEGDAGKAVSILEGRVPEDRYELMNILGVAYAGAGEYEKAREAFEKAAGGECANARYNLGQVLGVIDQL